MTNLDIQLKGGMDIVIREATLHDAAGILKCIRTYIAQSPYMAIEPEEFTLNIHEGREWIHKFIEEENSVLIVAEHGEQIVGNFDITGARRTRLQHNGLIGMGMLSSYQGKGLGTALMQAGIDWAVNNTYLERLWLQVLSENAAAISLYRKMGFSEDGLQKNFIRVAPGVYKDNLIMGLMLPRSEKA